MRRLREFTLVVALLAMACEGAHHDVVVRNTGSRDITDARVEYSDAAFTAGVVVPRSDAKVLALPRRIPKEATVSWTDAHGARHREKVLVNFPEGFKGVLVFEIDDANRLRVLTEALPHYTLYNGT